MTEPGVVEHIGSDLNNAADSAVGAVLSPAFSLFGITPGPKDALGKAAKDIALFPLNAIVSIVKGLALGTLHGIKNVALVTPFLPTSMADSWMNERGSIQNSTKDQLATLKNALPGFSIG